MCAYFSAVLPEDYMSRGRLAIENEDTVWYSLAGYNTSTGIEDIFDLEQVRGW